MLEWIEGNRREYEARIAFQMERFNTGCEHCQGLPIGGGYDLKYDCGELYGLEVKEDVVSCPVCKRVVATWGG